MKRVRKVRVPASIVSSDSDGNDEEPQPAKKPRKSSVKSQESVSRPSPDVKIKIKRAKAEKKEVLESVSKAGQKDEVRGGESWTPAEVISRDLQLDLNITQNTVGLLLAGNSVPFLAR